MDLANDSTAVFVAKRSNLACHTWKSLAVHELSFNDIGLLAALSCLAVTLCLASCRRVRMCSSASTAAFAWLLRISWASAS